MDRFRVTCLLLLTLCTTSVLAQQVDDEASSPDEIALDEFVRELRSEQDVSEPEPPSANAIEQWLAAGSRTVERMVESGCDLDSAINSEIQRIETQLARIPSDDSDEVRTLNLQLVELRQRAIRDCCEQETVVCFE